MSKIMEKLGSRGIAFHADLMYNTPMDNQRHPKKGNPWRTSSDGKGPVTRRDGARSIGTTSAGVHYDMEDSPGDKGNIAISRGKIGGRKKNRSFNGKRLRSIALSAVFLIGFAAIGQYGSDLVFVEDAKRSGFLAIEATIPPLFSEEDEREAMPAPKPPLSALINAAAPALSRIASPVPEPANLSTMGSGGKMPLYESTPQPMAMPVTTILETAKPKATGASTNPPKSPSPAAPRHGAALPAPPKPKSPATEGLIVGEGDPEFIHVWIPQSGSRYHATPTCSGMQAPVETTLLDARQQGFTPCLRCKPPE